MARKIPRIKTSVDILFYLLVVIGTGQMAYYYPLLPEFMATHFLSDGSANGWMSKWIFTCGYLSIMMIMWLAFYLAGKFTLDVNHKYISLPNKMYWLDSSRKHIAERYIARKGVYFSFYTLGFLLLLMQMVFEANIAPQVRLNNEAFVVLLALYASYTMVWVFSFIAYFKKTGD